MNIRSPQYHHNQFQVVQPPQAENYGLYYPYGRQPVMQTNQLNGFFGPMIQMNQMMYPINQQNAYIPIPSSKPVQMQIQIMAPTSAQVTKPQTTHRQSVRRCNMSENRAWTPEEDAIIMSKYKALGARFEMIASFLQNRSTTAVHNRLLELQRNYPMPTITVASNNANTSIIQQQQLVNVNQLQQKQSVPNQQIPPKKVIEVSKPTSFLKYIQLDQNGKKDRKIKFEDFEFVKADIEPMEPKNICLSFNPDLECFGNYV